MEQAEKNPDMRMMEAAGILSDQTAFKDATDYGIDFDQPEYRLTLPRLMRHDAALALVLAAREAGIQYYGFDPRHPKMS